MTQYEKILTYTIDEMAKFACSRVCTFCEESGYCDVYQEKCCIELQKEFLMREVKE
jgi:hypothetical protein